MPLEFIQTAVTIQPHDPNWASLNLEYNGQIFITCGRAGPTIVTGRVSWISANVYIGTRVNTRLIESPDGVTNPVGAVTITCESNTRVHVSPTEYADMLCSRL
jgi:hypothetical protein